MASVGNDTVKHDAHHMRARPSRCRFCFCFLGGRSQLNVELDHSCGVENFYSAHGALSYHVVDMVRQHPRGSYIVLPLQSLEVAYRNFNMLKLSSIRKSASQAFFSRTQLTLHATRRIPRVASRLVQAMPARSVKTRHAPSRHCRSTSMAIRLRPCMNIEYISPGEDIPAPSSMYQ